MSKDNLGDRMKTYENVTRAKMVRRMPVIIRLDGKAFHSFTRGFQKPFDAVLMKTMQDTMKYLCENIQGCVFGYTQSDEISLLLIDYQTLTSDAWFDNTVQKMCSVSASMTTLAFNKFFSENFNEWGRNNFPDWDEGGTNQPVDEQLLKLSHTYGKREFTAMFDSRVFNIPKEDVVNCFVWRQQDATRNSIQSAGQANFSHKQLMNKTCDMIQDMLFIEKGINWNDYPTACKRGSCCRKRMMEISCQNDSEKVVMRKKWVVDTEIPIFSQDTDYINRIILLED